MTAAMMRTKKMPALNTLVRRRMKPQTAREQKQMLQILSQQHGGRLRPARRREAR